MRLALTVIISIILVIIINTFASKIGHLNTMLFALFAAVMIFKLMKNISSNYKLKSGDVCKGKILRFNKRDESEVAEIEYSVHVSFISPYDEVCYNINSTVMKKPKTDEVYVLINKDNPNKSKIIEKTSASENVFLVVSGFIFIYLAFRSW